MIARHLTWTLLLLATSALADDGRYLFKQANASAPPQLEDYVVSLKHPSRIPHPADRALPAKAYTPDLAQLGGLVRYRRGDMMVVRLPSALLEQLRNHPSVLFVQQVWNGEPPTSVAHLTPTTNGTETTDPVTNKLYWTSGTYSYDGSGNIMRIGNDTYVYDGAQRLKRSTVNAKTETYGYDALGNLIEKTTPDSTFIMPSVDSSSNRLSAYQYDTAGNMQSFGNATYAYDGVNMLAQVQSSLGQTIRFLYTATDERVGVQVLKTADVYDGFTRWRFRDFDGHVIREFKGSMGSPLAWVQDYIYADGRLVAGERIEPYGGRVHYHLDHLGSVRLITKSKATGDALKIANHEYYPFGQEQTFLGQEVTNFAYERPDVMKFTSHERDFFGQYDTPNDDYTDYMHAREYNPILGRFLSADPVPGDPHRPQSWNRYTYVLNNPMNYSDPFGLEPKGGGGSGGSPNNAECPAGTEGISCFTFNYDGPGSFNAWFNSARADFNLYRLAHLYSSKTVTGFFERQIQGMDARGQHFEDCWYGAPAAGVDCSDTRMHSGTVVIGGLGGFTDFAAAESVSVTFSEQAGVAHGVGHLGGTGITEAEARAAIQSAVKGSVAGAVSTPGASFWGRVVINGRAILYKAFVMSDGSVNVGTFWPF